MFQKLTIKNLQHLRGCSMGTAKNEYKTLKAILQKKYITVLDFAKIEQVEPEIVLNVLK